MLCPETRDQCTERLKLTLKAVLCRISIYWIIHTTCKPWLKSYPSTFRIDGDVLRVRQELDREICQVSIRLLISIFSREALRIKSSDGANTKCKHTNYKVRSNASKVESCILCKGGHDLDDCEEYLKSIDERRKFLAEKQLCYSCYMPGHRSRGCSQKRTCKTCSRCHPTGLHVKNFQPILKKPANDNVEKNVESAATLTTTAASGMTRRINNEGLAGSMPIVPVIVRSAETESITYAMLDNCSTGTFILEDLRQELNVDGVDSQISITTMNGNQVHNVKVVKGLTNGFGR